MRHTTFLSTFLTATASFAIALPSPAEQYHIQQVCAPLNSTQQADLSFPCNVLYLLQYECIYGASNGASALEKWLNNATSIPYEEPSNELQRVCACESQYFDYMKGCAACFQAHGSSEPEVSDADVESRSRAYCAASATPTGGLMDYIGEWNRGSSATRTSKYSDPLASSTEVSLYFTPSVTGSKAWYVAEVTNSKGSTIQTELNTENGQIVATASPMTTVKPEATASTTTSGGGAAVRTEGAAVAGALGLAAVMALL